MIALNIFSKINDKYPNYIELFASHSTVVCVANLGPDEPENYPDNYALDEICLVTDLETKINHIE